MPLVSKLIYSALGFSIIFLYSCSDNSANSPKTSNDTLTVLEGRTEIIPYVTSNTRNLRVRITPDLQGEVIEVVPIENTVLQYLQDSTHYETKIGQGKETISARWYKLLTPSGKEGWAYGAFISFKSPTENRAIMAQIKADSIKLAKDPHAGTALTNRKRPKGDEIVNEAIVEQYSTYVRKLNENNINSVKLAADEMQRLVDNASSATADRTFMIFKNFFGRIENTVKRNTNIQQYLHLKEDIKKFGRINTSNMQQLATLEDNGFILAVVDDQLTIAQDIDFLARQFYRLVSPEMRQYLNQIQLESETHWRTQDKLIITPKKLSDWLVFWSNFADSNNKFVLYSAAREKANEYLSILLQGLPNTPVFDSEESLNANYKEAYEHIIETSRDSDIGEIINDYFNVLTKNDFKFDSGIKAKQIEILK